MSCEYINKFSDIIYSPTIIKIIVTNFYLLKIIVAKPLMWHCHMNPITKRGGEKFYFKMFVSSIDWFQQKVRKSLHFFKVTNFTEWFKVCSVIDNFEAIYFCVLW